MKTMIRRFFSLIRKGITIVLLAIFLIVMIILKNNTDIAEAWTNSFACGYAHFMSNLTSWIPFSLTEVFYISIFILFIVLIIISIKQFIKLEPLKACCKLLTIAELVLLIVTMYTATCEFAYNRKPVDLPFYETQVENEQIVDIYNYFADDLNFCISKLEFEENEDVKASLSIREVTNLIQEEYKKIDSDYFYQVYVNAKPMMSSFLYRELQITGVTNAIFTEANINYLETNVDLPMTIAHELAHTKGVMREDDAYQVAFYVCLNSDNEYLRFSAYINYFYQMKRITTKDYLSEEQRNELHKVDSQYSKTYNFVYYYWQDHDLLGDIGDFFNNMYIKSSGVEEGTASYQGGTDIKIDETTKKLVASSYHKLFFEKYFRNKNS